VAGRWFSQDTLVSSNNKTDHNIIEILLKVALNTITISITSMAVLIYKVLLLN